jgi:hypothetical protein
MRRTARKAQFTGKRDEKYEKHGVSGERGRATTLAKILITVYRD